LFTEAGAMFILKWHSWPKKYTLSTVSYLFCKFPLIFHWWE